MPTMQDSTHFRGPDDVDTFFSLGQRISQLTYNFNNRIGIGFLERRDGGLSVRSEEHTSELQSLRHLVCRLLLEKTRRHDESLAFRAKEEVANCLSAPVGRRKQV